MCHRRGDKYKRVAKAHNLVLKNMFSSFKHNHPLHTYTTFGIGGPATHFIEINTIPEMQQTLRYCADQHLRYFILGKGSNILFDDKGFDGLVILNKINFIRQLSSGTFHVGGGYSFPLLSAQTIRENLGGLEFASGIPGSVGGAVFMNAGANGSETATYLKSVDFVNSIGDLVHYPREKLTFSYRTSPFQKMQGAIVGAIFTLSKQEDARSKQLELINHRKKTQPYKEHSAGCVFANPHGACASAGALIDQSGLKGISVGDAAVSTIHANFIVNKGRASSNDVLALIHLIKTRVKEQWAVDLECEIRYIAHKA